MDFDRSNVARVQATLKASGMAHTAIQDSNGETYGFLIKSLNIAVYVDNIELRHGKPEPLHDYILLSGSKAVSMWCAMFGMSGYA